LATVGAFFLIEIGAEAGSWKRCDTAGGRGEGLSSLGDGEGGGGVATDGVKGDGDGAGDGPEDVEALFVAACNLASLFNRIYKTSTMNK